MLKKRLAVLVLILAAAAIGWFVYYSQVNANSQYKFKLGLDLNGGTELVYRADSSKIRAADVGDSMNTLRDVINNRVNAFGVAEPIIQVEKVGLVGGESTNQLLVELPGVTDVNAAIAMIGETPMLDFRLLPEDETTLALIKSTTTTDREKYNLFIPTGLTGKYLSRSTMEFDQNTSQPVVALQFNSEGADLFAKITKENAGKYLAIFLDGYLKSMPVIREEIRGGKATIYCGFT
ncbi:MAG: protein translocase subunit SecD, partial [bacterium]